MADSIKIGNLDISAFKVGNADCKVYLGDTLLYPTTPPTPPTFQGKWLATYQDSHTESAECDSTSAITYTEITKTDLVSVEIGDCVTSIGEYVLDGCSSLTSVTIPNSVTNIGSAAFRYCTRLTCITCEATVPPTLSGRTKAFGNTNNCPIYVPSASVSAYQSAWSNYSSRIQAIPNS